LHARAGGRLHAAMPGIRSLLVAVVAAAMLAPAAAAWTPPRTVSTYNEAGGAHRVAQALPKYEEPVIAATQAVRSMRSAARTVPGAACSRWATAARRSRRAPSASSASSAPVSSSGACP
jgi:hypothetical protein